MTCADAVKILRRWRAHKLPPSVQHLIFRASAHVANCRCERCSAYHQEEVRPFYGQAEILRFPSDRAPSVSTAR